MSDKYWSLKKCSCCNKQLPNNYDYKLCKRCREKRRISNKKSYEKHKPSRLEYQKKYRQEHPESKAYHKDYHTNNKEKYVKYSKNYRQTERGRLSGIRYSNKRYRNMKTIEIFKNPFPRDIKVHLHHLNNLLVVPIPATVHNKCNMGINKEEHKKRCNIWLYYLYGIDFDRLFGVNE